MGWVRIYYSLWRQKEFEYAADVRRFMFAGKAAFDIQYMMMGARRFSVRVVETADPDRHLVSMKVGKPRAYMGEEELMVPRRWFRVGIADSKSLTFEYQKNSGFARDSGPILDFETLLRNIRWPKKYLDLPDGFVVQHYGRCGRCKCELKHPRSIAIGICAKCNKAIGRRRWPPLRWHDPYGADFRKQLDDDIKVDFIHSTYGPEFYDEYITHSREELIRLSGGRKRYEEHLRQLARNAGLDEYKFMEDQCPELTAEIDAAEEAAVEAWSKSQWPTPRVQEMIRKSREKSNDHALDTDAPESGA